MSIKRACAICKKVLWLTDSNSIYSQNGGPYKVKCYTCHKNVHHARIKIFKDEHYWHWQLNWDDPTQLQHERGRSIGGTAKAWAQALDRALTTASALAKYVGKHVA